MVGGVFFGRLMAVLLGMQMMRMGEVGVMGGRLMVAGLMMRRSFMMMLGGMLMMMCRFFMMLVCCFGRHGAFLLLMAPLGQINTGASR